jgi:hypothetical protein
MKKLTPQQLTFDTLDSHWDPNCSIYHNMSLDELLLRANHKLRSNPHVGAQKRTVKDENHGS